MAAYADDVAMGAGAGGDVDEDGLPNNSSRGQRWSRDATLLVLRAMVKHGWTGAEVQTVMGVPRSTALKRWQDTGVVGTDTARLPAAGRGSKRLGAAGIEFLLLLVKEYPTYYLREYVEKLDAAGYTLHKSSVDAVLVEQGITFKQASEKRVRAWLWAQGGGCACGKARQRLRQPPHIRVATSSLRASSCTGHGQVHAARERGGTPRTRA